MIKNKRGLSGGSVVLWAVIVLIVGFILYSLSTGPGTSAKNDALKEVFSGTNQEKLDDLLSDSSKVALDPVFKFVFGMHPGTLLDLGVDNIGSLSMRGAVIILATWVIFFLIFTDMSILVMGFGSKLNGLLIGVAVTLIFANFGLAYDLIMILMGVFSFLAGLSVIAALFSIIVLGVGAHYGIGGVLKSLQTKQEIWNIQKGGAKIAAGAGVLKGVANAAEKGE